MWTSSSEGSIAQSCAGSWNVAGSNIRRSKSSAASGCDDKPFSALYTRRIESHLLRFRNGGHGNVLVNVQYMSNVTEYALFIVYSCVVLCCLHCK